MNPKLLLVTSIILLFRESQQTNLIENSSDLVRKIITELKLPDHSLTLDQEKGILTNLISTAHMMCSNPVNHVYDPDELLQRLRIDVGEDQVLYESFVKGLTDVLDEAKVKVRCLSLKNTLIDYFENKKIEEILNKAAYTLKFKREEIPNMRGFVGEVHSQLERFRVKKDEVDPALIGVMHFDTPDSIVAVADSIKSRETGGSYFKTGFQLIDRQTGGYGIRRGELFAINALQHNYKSGLSRALFAGIALNNKPIIKDNRKPMLLWLSFEDTLQDCLEYFYKFLYENETRQVAEINLLSPDEIANYVKVRLEVNGWHIHIAHVNPYIWNYRNLCDYVVKQETEGYEVQLCMVDYLAKMPTIGCDGNAAGEPLRNLFERVKAFMQARNIAFGTPQQISTDAKMMIREGRNNFVKELPGKGYYAGCKQLDQVYDLEFYIHIEYANGKAYLTIQRGKHRKIEQTPLNDLYGVLPFNPVGPLLLDSNGKDLSLKSVGGGPIGSGEEIPFWVTE